MNKSLIPVLLLLAASQAALAQSADEQKFPQMLTQARAGCGAAGGTLRWSPELAKVAARVQKGEKAADAIGAEGYRAMRLVRTNAQAPAAEEVAKLVARDNCSALTDARVSDVGYVRTGNDWVVLLAAPLSAPALADKKAATQKVVALLNDARRQARSCGVEKIEAAEALKWSDKLAEAAAMQARDMAQHSYLSITSKDGSTPPERIAKVGYKASKSTESIAAGLDTPERVVQQWLADPEACKNIMNAAFTETAVSYEVNAQSRSYVYWALELAAPMADGPASEPDENAARPTYGPRR